MRFWLAGYVPLTYHLYRIYNTVTMKVAGGDMMVVMSVIVAAVLAFLLYLIFGLSGQHQDMLELTINLAYPISRCNITDTCYCNTMEF